MNKIVKAGVTLIGNLVLGQAIVFITFVTVGMAGDTVERMKRNRDRNHGSRGRRA